MKRFHFRLERVLSLREQEEELAKLELGKATRTCEELRLGIETRKQLARDRGFSSYDPTLFQAHQAYLSRLEQERRRLGEQLVKAETVRIDKLSLYHQSQQKAEVLRRYEERLHGEFRKRELEKEDEAVDDLVQARLPRKGSLLDEAAQEAEFAR